LTARITKQKAAVKRPFAFWGTSFLMLFHLGILKGDGGDKERETHLFTDHLSLIKEMSGGRCKRTCLYC
jgi:hypothetical protein